MENDQKLILARKHLLFISILLLTVFGMPLKGNATIWYAAPNASGTGTLSSPFGLQAAFNSLSIHAGDILYLRGGSYRGRFVCNLIGNKARKITVMSYPAEWAVLDGHVPDTPNPDAEPQVLRIAAVGVIFRDFEVTYTQIVRSSDQPGYKNCIGIKDYNGSQFCEFINLVVHDNPGNGFDTWKEAEGSFVYGCLIYNNGCLTPGEARVQHGPGMYIQNKYNEYKIIKNNIVFNNFWVGFEAWSASTQTPLDFIKYFTFDDNTMFNNGQPASPYGIGECNLLLKTMDNNGSNIIRNVNIVNNTLYHNTTYTGNLSNPTYVDNTGEAPAMEVGNVTSAYPSDSILIHNNYISGKNPAIRINDINNLTFTNNNVLGRYVEINYSNKLAGRINSSNWHFDNNHYYTFGSGYSSVPGLWGDRTFRMLYLCGPDNDGDGVPDNTCTEDYYLPSNMTSYLNYCTSHGYNPGTAFLVWKYLFPGLDTNSQYSLYQMNQNASPTFSNPPISYANPPNVLKITQNIYKPNQFKVVLLSPPTSLPATGPYTIAANFSAFEIPFNTPYKIIDIESYPAVAATGNYNGSTVTFDLNMTTPPFNGPYGQGFTAAQRTPGNFGVFLIEFDRTVCNNTVTVSEEVITGNNDLQQAGTSLVAINEVNNAATAAYHAPQVSMKAGFHAANGSSFRSYPLGCTNTYVAKLIEQSEVPVPEFPRNAASKIAVPENQFVIQPNPTTGIFKIQSTSVPVKRVVITAVSTGEKLFEKNTDGSTQATVDISKARSGLYIVQVYFNDNSMGTKTIAKE